MKTNLKKIIVLLPLTFLSANVLANEVAPTEKKEAFESIASDNMEENLGKISLLKSKLEIIKLEKSIEKEKAESVVNDNMNNDYNGYNNYNYNNNKPVQQSPIPSLPEATEEMKVENETKDDMKAIAVYGLGNMSYAEILVNGGKVIVRNGETLSNGYQVKSLSNIGVVLTRNDEKITLPITASVLPNN